MKRLAEVGTYLRAQKHFAVKADSVTDEVLQSTPVPVEVVVGNAVSKWESWGLPAGVLGVGGLLLMSAY